MHWFRMIPWWKRDLWSLKKIIIMLLSESDYSSECIDLEWPLYEKKGLEVIHELSSVDVGCNRKVRVLTGSGCRGRCIGHHGVHATKVQAHAWGSFFASWLAYWSHCWGGVDFPYYLRCSCNYAQGSSKQYFEDLVGCCGNCRLDCYRFCIYWTFHESCQC